jgi:N-sulfoglucosamine sulfohydrolase
MTRTMRGTTLLIWLLLLLGSAHKPPISQPNILWLTIEDTSPYLFPAYGNMLIKTPNLDWLAQRGVVYDNAFANAPYCSPARSSLISGRLATTFGNDIHREGRPVPAHYFFPPLMRSAGYYCTNQGKTDYNIPDADEERLLEPVWDVNGAKGTYNDTRRGDKPFFGVFNNISTHMSRLTTVTLEARKPCRVRVASGEVPPYVPDLPETRADYALHLESIEDADRWVGTFLNDLKARKLLDNTIIFFFSDHGGCLPRGKAFPFDTGLRSAFIAYVPPKWQHLIDEKPGTHSTRLVTLADFGPTVLSLAGERPPEYMHGRPFMGLHRQSAPAYAHTFRTNSGNHFDPSRTVYDGRYHYIREYVPFKIHALRQAFQWGMPSQLAWDRHVQQQQARPEHQAYYQPKPSERLFDLMKDPWELNNLADKPAYQQKLTELRAEVVRNQLQTQDAGFMLPSERRVLAKTGGNLHDIMQRKAYPLIDLLTLVNTIPTDRRRERTSLLKHLTHPSPSFRYWALVGLTNSLRQQPDTALIRPVRPLLTDSCPEVAAAAAEALTYTSQKTKAIQSLVEMTCAGNGAAASALEGVLYREKLTPNQVNTLLAAVDMKRGEMAGGFTLRSILINAGAMSEDSLFGHEQKRSFLRDYRQRVAVWAPTTPNPGTN